MARAERADAGLVTDRAAYDAIVLAGGAASRLGGADKATVRVRGRPLLDYALAAVADASTLVVVGQTAATVPPRAIRVVEDPPRSGPAAAVTTGLGAIATPAAWTVLLACDSPGAAECLELVFRADDAADGVVVSDEHGRPQWLLGRYRTQPLRAAAAALADPRDRSMRALLGALQVGFVTVPNGAAHDVDTWADRAAWEGRRDR